MKRRRAVVTGTLLGLVILGAAGSDVRALDTPPMSWWGYWAGRKGDTKPGAKFLRRGSRPIVDGTTGELLDPGWPGTQRDRILQASGKWIGRNLAFDPCEWTP